MQTIDAPSRRLENGRRATTPAGDNLLLDFARTEATAAATLARAAGGRVADVDDLGMVMSDAGSPCPFGNVTHLSRPLDPDETGTAAEILCGFYGKGTGGPFLVFSPSHTGDLRRWGFGLVGHPPFMLRPAVAPGATAGAGALPREDSDPHAEGLRIVEVRTPAVLADFERTLIDAYPAPELAPFGSAHRLFGHDLLDSAWRLFVGYVDDEPVATASGFARDRVVVVEAVSTRPAHRGRGYGAAMTSAALHTAPGLPSALIASDQGRRVYEALGFLPVTRYTLWVGRRDDGAGAVGMRRTPSST